MIKAKSFMASCYTMVCILLLLHFFQFTGVWGAKFTLINNCSQIIWPAILGRPRLQSMAFELPRGSSIAVQAPVGWNGRLWGRTGCTFDASSYGYCATGDCGSGQMECDTNATATTLVELNVGGVNNLDFYDVSLVNGYNLPLLLEPSSRRCSSTGCVEDLNQICPSKLKTQGGAACRGACEAFNTSEYCCNAGNSACGPTNYSQVFKKACPNAYSYPLDDASSLFACTTGADYFITFCPTSSAQTGIGMPPAQSPGHSPESLLPAQSPGYSPESLPPAQSPGYSPESLGNLPDPPRPRTGNGKNSIKVIITVVVALSIAGVVVVSIFLHCFLKKGRSTSVPSKAGKQNIEGFLLQHGSLTPKRYKYSEIKKITKSFSDKLGQGGYGSVYKGVLPDGSLVAVKVLIENDNDGEEFINEVASISRTSHVNIVSLLGFCYEKNKRALVYEFMPNKSLDKFLNNDGSAGNRDCCLDLEKLYKIAVGIAKGLEYLHTGCSTRIVHFDIKPQNILLDEDFCPKISDFGLAKLCKKKQSVISMIGGRGTIGYIAPEVFSRNFGGVSHKSDVYSYGMLVLEMAGARKIIETEAIQSSENYFSEKIYERVILDVTKKLDDSMVEEEEETRRKMLLVGFWCIQTIPADRPSMSKVVEMLEASLQSIQIPPKPFLFSPRIPEQEISSSLPAHVETENSAQD